MAVDANLGRKMVDDYNCKIIQQGPFMPLLPNEIFENQEQDSIFSFFHSNAPLVQHFQDETINHSPHILLVSLGLV